jgi:hypothetical protein
MLDNAVWYDVCRASCSCHKQQVSGGPGLAIVEVRLIRLGASLCLVHQIL